MIEADPLGVCLGLGEVGAIFAGFSGVVVVFGQRPHGTWFPEERFRLTNMMLTSLGACLFAFVPPIGALLHLTEPALWATASTLMGAFCVGYFLYALPIRLRLHQIRRDVLPFWATLIFVLLLCSAAALQALNAASVLFAREPGPYVAGLLLLLIAAGLQFGFLVLIPLPPE